MVAVPAEPGAVTPGSPVDALRAMTPELTEPSLPQALELALETGVPPGLADLAPRFVSHPGQAAPRTRGAAARPGRTGPGGGRRGRGGDERKAAGGEPMRAVVLDPANQQTRLPVEGFPHPYSPARHLPGGIEDAVGGVGFNVAAGLARLGAAVELIAPLANDAPGQAVPAAAHRLGIGTGLCTRSLERTPRSVVLVDTAGRRQVNTDLGEALAVSFDPAAFRATAAGTDVCVLGNHFSRPLLPAVRGLGVPVVVDLQDVRGPDHPYDQDFLAADTLVMSHERLPDQDLPGFLRTLRSRSRASLPVLTLGADGSLALTPDDAGCWRTPAVDIGPVPDTTGAGDAFTAALAHALHGLRLPARKAVRAATAHAASRLSPNERRR
ncbi:carbohydrate kinase family protein [Streptomyces milbemycinicus]|uniref:Carbohydrate kinase family protein n=1 Tax=Streptomyces milbemycinicus TaxID=476552 RepID=A0ABW8LV27_9ACTN